MSNSPNHNLLKIGNRVLKIGGRVLRPLSTTPPAPVYTILFNTDSEYNYGSKVNFDLPSTVPDRYILYKWHGTIRTAYSSFGASDYSINENLLRQRAHYAKQTVGFTSIDTTKPQFVPSYDGVFTWDQDGVTYYTDNSYPCKANLSGTNRLIVDQTDRVGHLYWRPDVNPDSYPNYKGYIVYSNDVNLVATQLSIDNEISYYPRADHISVVSSNDLQTLVDY